MNMSILKAATTVYKRICKANDPAKRGSRNLLSEAWTDKAGRACVCDGYRAIRLNTMPSMVQHDSLTGDRLDLDKVFPKDAELVKIAAPTAEAAAKLAEYKKQAKAEHVRADLPVVFGEYTVNPDYIADMIKVFPAADWYGVNGKSGKLNVCGAIVIRAAYGDAILLPVRTTDSAKEKLFHVPTEANEPEAAKPEQEAAPEPEQPKAEAEADAEPVAEQPEAKEQTAKQPEAIPAATYADYQKAIGQTISRPAYRIILDADSARIKIVLDVTNGYLMPAVLDAGYYYSNVSKTYNKRLNYKNYKKTLELMAKLDRAVMAA